MGHLCVESGYAGRREIRRLCSRGKGLCITFTEIMENMLRWNLETDAKFKSETQENVSFLTLFGNFEAKMRPKWLIKRKMLFINKSWD